MSGVFSFILKPSFNSLYRNNLLKTKITQIYARRRIENNFEEFGDLNSNNGFDEDDDLDIESELEKIFRKNLNDAGKLGIRVIFPKNNPPPFLKEKLSKKEKKENKKSKNFELIYNNDFNFKNVGGYNLVKNEMLQCADILVNYTKYEKYNVRTPKGMILEGPPGNGKTLLVKGLSGEIDVGFIPVSGSQFQELYTGVGASRVRELFEFAKENKPCIIFLDELDSIGRKRGTDTDSSSSERDSTLNELLVALDGFKDSKGIFVIGATNRIDMLDPALIRAGRIDKKIYVGNPDAETRRKILKIHSEGKPFSLNVEFDKLVQLTNGFSGSDIENLLNEAMLHALRNGRELIETNDLELIANRILTGWQITETKLSAERLKQVAIHEVGHALVSIFTKYRKILKVSINLWSPNSLGFTLFDESTDFGISTKEDLNKRIMVLLGGRIAEEIFYGEKVSSGAVDDLYRVKDIIQKMIVDYGMESNLFLPYGSEKYKEKIDEMIESVFNRAYEKTKLLLTKSKQLIKETADLLLVKNEITEDQITDKIKGVYDHLIDDYLS